MISCTLTPYEAGGLKLQGFDCNNPRPLAYKEMYCGVATKEVQEMTKATFVNSDMLFEVNDTVQ